MLPVDDQEKTVGGERQIVRQLQEALHRTGNVIEQIGPNDWSRPTLWGAWTVRDLLNHMAAVTMRFTSFADGNDEPRMPRGDLLGENPPSTYWDASQRAVSAWRANPEPFIEPVA